MFTHGFPPACHWTQPCRLSDSVALPDGPYGWSNAAAFMQFTVPQLHFFLDEKPHHGSSGAKPVMLFSRRFPLHPSGQPSRPAAYVLTAISPQAAFVYISMWVSLHNGSEISTIPLQSRDNQPPLMATSQVTLVPCIHMPETQVLFIRSSVNLKRHLIIP